MEQPSASITYSVVKRMASNKHTPGATSRNKLSAATNKLLRDLWPALVEYEKFIQHNRKREQDHRSSYTSFQTLFFRLSSERGNWWSVWLCSSTFSTKRSGPTASERKASFSTLMRPRWRVKHRTHLFPPVLSLICSARVGIGEKPEKHSYVMDGKNPIIRMEKRPIIFSSTFMRQKKKRILS